MVSFTANKALGLPTVGGDTGVWGPPLNNNSSAIDMSFGGSVTIPISSVAGALTLLASNYLNVFITFTGNITQNTVITLPAIGSFYTIQNFAGNLNSFTVTLQTTAAGGQAIGCPGFQAQDIMTDGSNVKYRGLPHIGAYWDYAGSSVPNWVSACTVPPWLNCDGTAFSSVTYPYLATILGGTTRPDARGRVRAILNQGTGRITAGISGVDGNTILAVGGNESVQAHTHANSLNDPGHFHTINLQNTLGGAGGGGATQVGSGDATNAAVTGITISNASFGAGGSQNVQPTYVGGLTLIRAG